MEQWDSKTIQNSNLYSIFLSYTNIKYWNMDQYKEKQKQNWSNGLRNFLEVFWEIKDGTEIKSEKLEFRAYYRLGEKWLQWYDHENGHDIRKGTGMQRAQWDDEEQDGLASYWKTSRREARADKKLKKKKKKGLWE